jgi:DNA-directed RNA polymerase specialized sigma24 family protein
MEFAMYQSKFIGVIKKVSGQYKNKKRFLEYEDLVQEGLIHLYQMATKYDGKMPIENFAKLFKTHLILEFQILFTKQTTLKRDPYKNPIVLNISDLAEDFEDNESAQQLYINYFIEETMHLLSSDAVLYLREALQNTGAYAEVYKECEARRTELASFGKIIPQNLPSFSKVFASLHNMNTEKVRLVKNEIGNLLCKDESIRNLFCTLSETVQKEVADCLKGFRVSKALAAA